MATEKWLYKKGDQRHGPVNSADLRRLAEIGRLGPDDLIWREGMGEWVRASEVVGLFLPAVVPEATVEHDAQRLYLEDQMTRQQREPRARLSRSAIASLVCGLLVPAPGLCELAIYSLIMSHTSWNDRWTWEMEHRTLADNLDMILVLVPLASGAVIGLLAVVFGIIGIRETKREQCRGRRLAVAGLVLPFCWCVQFAIGFVLLLLLA